MLAVDVSGSMAAEDMAVAGRRVDRLRAVKVVIGDFPERRVGDRVGRSCLAGRVPDHAADL